MCNGLTLRFDSVGHAWQSHGHIWDELSEALTADLVEKEDLDSIVSTALNDTTQSSLGMRERIHSPGTNWQI